MTCAFVPCSQTTSCPLAGGCVQRRFAHVPTYKPKHDKPRDDAAALNGQKKATRTRKAKK